MQLQIQVLATDIFLHGVTNYLALVSTADTYHSSTIL